MSKVPQNNAKGASDIVYQITRTINGNIELGLNLKSTVPIAVLTPGAPNTEFTFTHNLGFVPNGFLVLSKDQSCDVYNGATTWTTSLMYLKCTQASVNLVLVAL